MYFNYWYNTLLSARLAVPNAGLVVRPDRLAAPRSVPILFAKYHQRKVKIVKCCCINKRQKTTCLLSNTTRISTIISCNIHFRREKRHLHGNSYKEIKNKLEMEENVTDVENEYVKQILEYTIEQIKNERPFSEIIFFCNSQFDHTLHPESFVEIIGELYDNMLLTENVIIFLDDIGFYDFHAQLKTNYLDVYNDYVKELTQELDLKEEKRDSTISDTSSTTSSSTSSDVDLGTEDINPWDIGLSIFFIGSFIIALIFTIVNIFKFKKVKNKQEDDQQNSIYELLDFDPSDKVILKILLLSIPSFIIMLYTFRYYLYYDIKRVLYKAFKKDIKKIKNTSRNSMKVHTNSGVGLSNSRTITTLVSNIYLKISKRYYPIGKDVGKKVVEKCIGLGCNSTRPLMDALAPKTPIPLKTTPNAMSSPTPTLVVSGAMPPSHLQRPQSSRLKQQLPTVKPTVPSLTADIAVDEALNCKANNNSVKAQALQEAIKMLENKPDLIPKANNVDKDTQKYHVNKHPSEEHKQQMASLVNTLSQEKEKQEQTSSNLKPSKVLLKNINNKEYQALPLDKNNANEFTATELVQACVDRALVKVENNPKANPEFKPVDIKLANGSTHTLNNSEQGIKLTDIGNAYAYWYSESKNSTPESNIKAKVILEEKTIIAPPNPRENIIIANGKTKHLLYGCYISEGDFMASGYLTSKKSGIQISTKQYKAFEKEIEKETTSSISENSEDTINITKPNNFVSLAKEILLKKKI
jgi:hypothetical protein